MAKEVEKLKSDLKHTMIARARAESKEDEVRNSLSAVEGELREVRGELWVAHNDLAETRDGLQSAQYELQMIRDELVTSRGELRESKEEIRAANGELRDKVTLLDEARREANEAVSSAERLTEECRGLRGDLYQQITLVAQRDEVIGRLRCGPRIFHSCAFSLDWRDSLFDICYVENHLKKRFGVATYFCFILKGKTK